MTRRSAGWCIRLDVGADPETGKRRQVSRQGFRTWREAQTVLNDLLLEREAVRRPVVSVFGPTVGDYLEEWLDRAAPARAYQCSLGRAGGELRPVIISFSPCASGRVGSQAT